jgi:uncharacterized protein (TIGR02996 family)
MPSSDGDGLRAAIVAQPDDDIVRLVYADWLEENGQPARAQFIRAQVAAAQAEPFGPAAREHERAAAALLGAHPEWRQPLKRWAESAEFARGFVESAQVNAATFPRNAEAVFAAEPVRALRVIRFASTTGVVSLAPLFDTPSLERITRLDVSGLELAPTEFELLSDSPFLTNLTDLSLRGQAVNPQWLDGFLTDPLSPALAGLDVYDLGHLGPRLAEVLPRLTHRLKRLNVGRIAFTSDQMQKVLMADSLREIEELRIEWFAGTAREGALSHLNPGFVIPWNRLRLLDLSGQRIGDDGVTEIVKELCRRKEPSPLRWLSLAGCRLGADAVRALVRSDEQKVRLYHLDVTLNGLSLSQCAALRTRFPEAIVKH